MKSVFFLCLSIVVIAVMSSACRKYDDNERVYFWPKRMLIKGEWQLARIANYPNQDDSIQTIDTNDVTFNSLIRINNFEYCE